MGKYGISALLIGVFGTVVIALGNMIIKKCMTKESYEMSPIRRFLWFK